MGKKICVSVSFKKHKIDAVRYAAYAVSGGAYVQLSPGKKGGVDVVLEPKPGCGAGAGLRRRFEAELADEKMRSSIADANQGLREFIIFKALSGAGAPPAEEAAGLTPAQEKELEALISQVEGEIKAEAAGKNRKDPLGITATWEEKYGAKHHAKKAKR